jgi:hypothetical protein
VRGSAQKPLILLANVKNASGCARFDPVLYRETICVPIVFRGPATRVLVQGLHRIGVLVKSEILSDVLGKYVHLHCAFVYIPLMDVTYYVVHTFYFFFVSLFRQ